MTNWYKILGVKNFSSSEEIKTAYRKLSKKFHPDVNDGDAFFEERFKEIQEAYESLNDVLEKNLLDNYLRGETTSNHQQEAVSGNDKAEQSSQNQSSQNPTDEPSSRSAAGQWTYQAESEKKTSDRSVGVALVSLIVVAVVILIAVNIGKSKNSSNSERKDGRLVYTPAYTTPPSGSERVTYEQRETRSRSLGDKFSIGSTKEEVLAMQGNPTSVSKFAALNEEIWRYGFSSVTFKGGRVSEYADHANNLRVEYQSQDNSTKVNNDADDRRHVSYFSVGSTKQQVLNIQGDPTSTQKFEALNEEIWRYGFSSVTFRSGKVNEYTNHQQNLSVRYFADPSKYAVGNNSGYFSIGSGKAEVLSVQGEPTSISKFEALNEEIWHFGHSTVTFNAGKVSEYSDHGNNLKMRY